MAEKRAQEEKGEGQRIPLEFPLGATSRIVVQRGKYRGKENIDARIYYIPAEATGPEPTWKPTKKGVCMPLATARQVGEAILSLLGEDEGLPEGEEE